jgi:hypothetical protein
MDALQLGFHVEVQSCFPGGGLWLMDDKAPLLLLLLLMLILTMSSIYIYMLPFMP